MHGNSITKQVKNFYSNLLFEGKVRLDYPTYLHKKKERKEMKRKKINTLYTSFESYGK
jgi:hypothetical protein